MIYSAPLPALNSSQVQLCRDTATRHCQCHVFTRNYNYITHRFLSPISMLMHAQRDTVMANLSVRPSVSHTLVL